MLAASELYAALVDRLSAIELLLWRRDGDRWRFDIETDAIAIYDNPATGYAVNDESLSNGHGWLTLSEALAHSSRPLPALPEIPGWRGRWAYTGIYLHRGSL